MEDDTQMDSECINIDDDKDRNYHFNERSASDTNQLFNADIHVSGGSSYGFQSSYSELSPPTSSCLSTIPEDNASGEEADQDQHRKQFTAEASVECIFHSLDLLDKMGGSLGDMVSVQGGDEELWRAEVRAIDHVHKRVRGYFFVKHHQWNENQLWKRESMGHAMDITHFKSIVSIVEGQWQGPYWKDNRY